MATKLKSVSLKAFRLLLVMAAVCSLVGHHDSIAIEVSTDNATIILSHEIVFPFSSSEEDSQIKNEDQDLELVLPDTLAAPAILFNIVGLCDLLVCLVFMLLYIIKFEDPLTVDSFLALGAAVLWFLFSIVWSACVTNLETVNTPENLIDLNEDLCRKPAECEPSEEASFSDLRLSTVLGFLCCLFASIDFWYMFIITPYWHKYSEKLREQIKL